MKKIIALVLTAVMLLALAGSAAAKTAPFPDITDSGLAKDVAVLQMLGVINGDEHGNFNPQGTLTRAQFCKMAVTAMGKGDQAALYTNRTIFPDVRAGHWARGYINYAVAGENKLIIGNSDGTFKPDQAITGAQAVTILMRMLGYSDADAGMLWPEGYLALASDKGLTKGITLTSHSAPMARADAARLFVNLLGTEKKSGGLFAATLGTTVPKAIIMELDVVAGDGTAGAVRTSKGIFKTANGVLPAALVGMSGTLVLDLSSKLLTMLPDNGRHLTIKVEAVTGAGIKGDNGVQYDIPVETPAYSASRTTTYGTVYIDIVPGMYVTLYYNTDGSVSSIFINSSVTETAVIAGENGAASVLTVTGGDAGFKVYRNGVPASVLDVMQYDVLTYDRSAKILYISDFRLTGYYEDCYPNQDNPSKITMMGHEFTVLPSAAQSLARYRVGSVITLLFTSDMKVAGAETSAQITSTAVGVVLPGITTSYVKVKLFNGLTVSGDPQLTETSAKQLNGELVSVSSVGAGKLSIVKQSSAKVDGNLDLAKMTLGSRTLSAFVKVYERVAAGPVEQISLDELLITRIPMFKVLYAGLDAHGRVDKIVLDDVTGDRYAYGILVKDYIKIDTDQHNQEIKVQTVSLKNSTNSGGTSPLQTSFQFNPMEPGGIVVNTDGTTVERLITLEKIMNVSRSSFYTRDNKVFLTADGAEYPVADNVQCYNKLTDTWFKSLNDARAFSETLTVYYDKAPDEGGKIRVVIAG